MRDISACICIILASAMQGGAAQSTLAPTAADGMASKEVILDEVEVLRGKEHYTKRDNPAVRLMEMTRDKAKESDPDRLPYLNYNIYEKIVLGVDYKNGKQGAEGHGPLSFLAEYVDTTSFVGRRVLNISLKERVATRYYRGEPYARKERVEGIRRVGLDDFIDQNSIHGMLNDIMREVDIFDSNITLLQNRFVGPFSRIAPDFYKFYITDTLTIDGTDYAELAFAPRTGESFGFVGRMTVAVSDSSYFVRNISLSVPSHINLNYVDRLALYQEYERDSTGTRLKKYDKVDIEFRIFTNAAGIYASRDTYYNDYDYRPAENSNVYSISGDSYVPMIASRRGDDYWREHRPEPLGESEHRIEEMVGRMRSVPSYFWAEKFVKALITGYIPTAMNDADSKFDIGPWNTLISGNDIEGTRFRLGGMTTASLSRRWFGRGYVAYGTRDRKVKYGAEIEYSFKDKARHSREFPIHSLMLSHRYDVDMLGQHYEFTNPDNFVLSITRMKNRLMTYKRSTQLKYTYESANHFSVETALNHSRQEAGPYLPFVNAAGSSAGHYDASTASVRLRYSPGETFFQTNSYRVPINRDAPIFTLEHTYGPKGVAGNRYEFNRTTAAWQQRFWFSAFGYLDCTLKGGHIWSSVPYPSLFTPNANISYTIQPETFALMNPLEFMADSYGELFLTYWGNGVILNHLPLVKRLKLREVFSFSGYLGSLSDKNKPEGDNNLYLFPDIARVTPMHGRPYMELSVGLDNILRIFRVDYVWRASYRGGEGIDRSGVRVAMHFTF